MSNRGVTMVIAAYNHASYVEQALESFAAQDADDAALIVTDDASTDDSRAVIEATLSRLGLDCRTVFNADNRGLCATFNSALDLVETPYVAFMSADDWMHPRRISRQRDVLEEAGEHAAFLYGDVLRAEEGSEPEPFSSRYPAEWGFGASGSGMFGRILAHNFIPAPSVMMRTACVRAVGGYDERLVYEDHDMWLRLSRRYAVAFLDEPLVYWRVTPSSLSSTLSAARQLDFHLSNLRILGKHEADLPDEAERGLLRSKLYDNATMAYRLGANTSDVRRHLLSGARDRGVKGWVTAAAAASRVPGPRLFPENR